MGRLIVSTQMTLDGVIEVGEWYVAEGDHDRAGKDQLAQGESQNRLQLLGCEAFDSGVALLRYAPAV